MDMLDATLAFALTLAALATIVTIILEAIHRLLRVRKWNLILTMQKLSGEIANDKLISAKGSWDLVASVLNNGTQKEHQKILTSEKLLAGNDTTGSIVSRIFGFLWDNVSTFSYKKMQKPNKEAGKDDECWLEAIDSIQRNDATRGVFDKVSLEHVLRRFSELDEVKAKLNQSRVLVESLLNKIARKYEVFVSSVTADFKRRSQMWSIIIGVIIALTVNVNAIRIFESYLKDQNLSSRVIGKFEQFEKQANEAQKNLDDALAEKKSNSKDKYAEQITQKQDKITGLIKESGKLTGTPLKDKNIEITKEQQALKELIIKAYAESEAGKAQQAMNKAGESLRSLSELGVPIGFNYFPHCKIEFLSDLSNIQTDNKTGTIPPEQCLSGEKKEIWSISLFVWILSTVLTGILIGMGAPFWFDVARRIAEVRSMFGGKQDNEKRMSGKDIDGDQKQRKKLVKNIVDDAITDQILVSVKDGG